MIERIASSRDGPVSATWMAHGRAVRLAAFVCLALAMAAPALAQVRSAPEGNSLPERQAPAAPAPADSSVGTSGGAGHPRVMPRAEHQRFAAQVDLSEFRKLSAFDGGRAKILDTLAREHLERIYGKPRFKDQWSEGDRQESHTYDPVFTLLDLIFNKAYYFDKPIIHVEVLRLREVMVSHLSPEKQELWKKRGRLTPLMISDQRMNETMAALEPDVLLQRAIGQVRMAAMAFDRADAMMDMVSPRPGSEAWSSLWSVGKDMAPGRDAKGDVIFAHEAAGGVAQLAKAWREGDAGGVNAALRIVAQSLPRVHSDTYPPAWKRSAELVYNRTERFTIGYLGYLAGALALLIALAVHRRWLIRAGVSLLVVGFVVHSLGMGVRIALSGRWPIHNQYESFIAIVWLAVLVGMALMLAKRQWLYGAAAAALGAAALLFANTVAIPSREVGQVAGILATSRILYVHVNLVLVSYGLIGLGFFVSLLYLFVHFTPRRHAALLDLDKAQMVILQLAFWVLGVGILLGAYWADHAWGRWWAWDPKETWALITWIIYLMVIHLRLAVKRRGLVTAWMSVLGFVVMLWTYWGVNLLLAGLHSYA